MVFKMCVIKLLIWFFMKKTINTKERQFFISCPKGLEELLKKEVNKRNVSNLKVDNGGINFKTSFESALEILLYSRIGSRLYLNVHNGSISRPKDIYKLGRAIKWDCLFTANQLFKINTVMDSQAKTKFNNSLFLSQILKDSIVDHFRDKYGKRPNVSTRNAQISFLQRIEKAQQKGSHYNLKIFLDLTGNPLSNRGNRINSGTAPLRENLASGIIQFTNWKGSNEVLIDSMCGSGTLLIEALLIKEKIPPSYIKIIQYIEKKSIPWAFLKHLWYQNDHKLQKIFIRKVNENYASIKDKIAHIKENQLFGYDIDPQAIAIAKKNLKNALLPNNSIRFATADACSIKPSSNQQGIILCNPPYGKRIGNSDDLEQLYYQYGENLKKNYKGYRAYIFTNRQDLRKKISLRTSKRIQLFNGNLECRLLEYKLF